MQYSTKRFFYTSVAKSDLTGAFDSNQKINILNKYFKLNLFLKCKLWF